MSGGTGKAAESRERELKLGVPDREAFDALIGAAEGRRDAPARQVNHFFDTAANTLRDRRIGFRVREEGECFFLTLKGPSDRAVGGMLSDRVELESELAPEAARAVLAGQGPAQELVGVLEADCPESRALLKAVREACAEAPLVEIGSFENERTRVRTTLAGEDVVLEFDRTCYPAGELRYEVEVELAPEQSADLLARELESLFAAAGVRSVPTTSKLKRFLEILDAAGPPLGR